MRKNTFHKVRGVERQRKSSFHGSAYYLAYIKRGDFDVYCCRACRGVHLDVGGREFRLKKVYSKDTWFLEMGGWRFEARFGSLAGKSPAGNPFSAHLRLRGSEWMTFCEKRGGL